MKTKIFRRICSLLLMTSAFSFIAFSKDEIAQSIWAASPLTIDGSNADWQDMTMNLMKKVEVDYAFKNDAQYLYVFFVFKNPKFMSTVRATGITLWFRTEGKDKKTYGINFKQKQVSGEELIAILERQPEGISEEQKKQLKPEASYLAFLGEVVDKKGKIIAPEALGGEVEAPVFKQKLERTGVSYEFRLPLNILEKLSAELRLEPGKSANIGFEWGGMTKELLERKVSQAEQKMDLSKDEGAMREGDFGGGAPSVRRGTQKYSFWVGVQLAQSQQ